MAASSSSASTGLSMRLRSPLASRSAIHSRRSCQATGRASLEPTAMPARSIACSSMALVLALLLPGIHCGATRESLTQARSLYGSEIRFRGARDREQALVEVILVVLGADRLDERIGHLAPALDQVERLIERV